MITPHMLIQFILLLVVVSKFIYAYDNEVRIKLTLLDKLLPLLGIASIFSLLYAYNFPTNNIKRWLLFYTGIFEPITFYFVILYFLDREKNFSKNLLLAIAFSSFSALLIAAIEFRMTGYSIISIFLSRMRIGFGYHNTNLFGIHSALIFPVLFYLIVSRKYQKYRIVTWTSFSVLLLLSVLCFNRGTFLVLGFQILLLYMIKENRKIIYLLMIVFIGFAVYYNELIILYIFRFFSGTQANPLLDVSALNRFAAWVVGLKIIFNYPLGVGAGAFQYFWEYWGLDSSFYLGTPHQLFLSVGVDYGVSTLLIFISILLVAFYYSSKLSKIKSADDENFFDYIRISIIGYVSYGMITDGELSHLSGFTFPNNGYTLFLILLLALISYKYNLKKS
ncbi:MAG: O-antigen ligase family protein [Ignavibacteria bacterium]